MLEFVAGSASEVFPADMAESIQKIVPSGAADVYRSEPVDPRGWAQLQSRVMRTLDAAPQIAGIDAYQSVYVPGPRNGVERVVVPNVADPLEIGSLDSLLGELRAFAEKAALPIDDVELMQLAAKYLEDDALFDADLDIQTYVQLLLTAKQAAAHGVALWIESGAS